MHLGILKLLCRTKNNKRVNVQCNLKCKEQFWWEIFKRRGSSLDLGGKLDLFGSESVEVEIKLGLTLISNLGRGRKQKKGGLQLLFRVRNYNLDEIANQSEVD